MLNKEKRGKVLELKVRCMNNGKGCEWVGELGDQDRHCTSRCQYVESVCQYGCGGSYPRFMLGKHEQDECPERPIDMKMATFTRQMMEKVSSLETKYEREIIALKQKLEDQEERHIMEKKELQRNYEEGKKEMLHEFEVQTKEMKKNTKTDKEQIVQIMKKEQERLTQQAEEMKKKAEADKKQIQIIKKEQEKCEAERRELANKLEKQREEYVVVGNQPLGGAMNHYVYSLPLPGYPKFGTIDITYQIPSGTQGPEHPNPGKATDSHNNIRCMYSWLNVCNFGKNILCIIMSFFRSSLSWNISYCLSS